MILERNDINPRVKDVSYGYSPYVTHSYLTARWPRFPMTATHHTPASTESGLICRLGSALGLVVGPLRWEWFWGAPCGDWESHLRRRWRSHGRLTREEGGMVWERGCDASDVIDRVRGWGSDEMEKPRSPGEGGGREGGSYMIDSVREWGSEGVKWHEWDGMIW